ncbi:hypothetical protein [Streptomyces niveus]|uniref:hypothetical protein n=1 Tax=Streptomyces niveus TaxID=193462 RepID=UPI003450F620
MITPRRTLGTGPTTSTRSTPPTLSRRLLPVERIDVEHELVDVEHQEHEPRERRRLGYGAGPLTAGPYDGR